MSNDKENSIVGTIVYDSGKYGIIINEISLGTWVGHKLLDWTVNYEIRYFDGTQCIMARESFNRLVEAGRIKILGGSNE